MTAREIERMAAGYPIPAVETEAVRCALDVDRSYWTCRWEVWVGGDVVESGTVTGTGADGARTAENRANFRADESAEHYPEHTEIRVYMPIQRAMADGSECEPLR